MLFTQAIVSSVAESDNNITNFNVGVQHRPGPAGEQHHPTATAREQTEISRNRQGHPHHLRALAGKPHTKAGDPIAPARGQSTPPAGGRAAGAARRTGPRPQAQGQSRVGIADHHQESGKGQNLAAV